jgi:hypothetical protein
LPLRAAGERSKLVVDGPSQKSIRLAGTFFRLQQIGFFKITRIDFFGLDEFLDFYAVAFALTGLFEIIFGQGHIVIVDLEAFDDIAPGHLLAVLLADPGVLDRAMVTLAQHVQIEIVLGGSAVQLDRDVTVSESWSKGL